MDLEDRWWAIANGVSAEVGKADPHALITGLVGAEIEVEVLGTDPWIARMLLADRYRTVGSSWLVMPRTSIRRGADMALILASAMP